MKKFSNQVKINESIDNTFLLGKNVKKLPDFFTDIKDLIETYKEYYDFIESISISYGYTSKENIKITKNPQLAGCVSFKNILSNISIEDGNIPDRWMLSVKTLIYYKYMGNSHNKDILDEMMKRINSLKTLSLRLEQWCDVSISVMGDGFIGTLPPSFNNDIGDGNAPVCLLAVVRDDNYSS